MDGTVSTSAFPARPDFTTEEVCRDEEATVREADGAMRRLQRTTPHHAGPGGERPAVLSEVRQHGNRNQGGAPVTLDFYCVMCGKDKQVVVVPRDGKIDVVETVERIGWIVQRNGGHFDIYCSKRCAK